MFNIIALRRHQAFVRQSHCCFYCECPMWERRPDIFLSKYAIPAELGKLVQCTAEHLKARCEGGPNTAENIVAACWHCNQKRHQSSRPLSPHDFSGYVRARMSKGRWQPPELRKLLVRPEGSIHHGQGPKAMAVRIACGLRLAEHLRSES